MKPFVFAIRPQYVARLLDGSKRVEYRTRRPRLERGDTILIYETAPTSAVVARATVIDVIVGAPAWVWSKTWYDGGIAGPDFMAYFDGREIAVAIELDVEALPGHVPLPDGMAPPQSWARWRGEWPLVVASPGD